MTIKLTGEDEVQRKPLISLEASNTPDYPDGYVAEKAAKIHLTLGQDSPGVDALQSALSVDNAKDYARLLADRDRLNRIQTRDDILSSIMQADPSQITPDVVNLVQGLSDDEITSPDIENIIDKKYSALYVNTATALLDNDIVDDAMEADPEASLEMMDRTERIALKKELATKRVAEVQKDLENQSFLGKAWDFTERNFIPFLEWYQKHNLVGQGNDNDFVSSILPGSNLEEQYAYLWGLEDSDQFSQEFNAAVDELKDRNLQVAASWLEGFFSYGGSDAVLDNIYAGIDVATVVPVGTLGRALKGVAKGAAKNPLKLFNISADLGKYDEAAVGKLTSELQEGTILSGDIRNLQELENSVPSISSPMKLLIGSNNVPQASYLRMKKALFENAELAKRFLVEPNLIDRATPEELLKYKDILLDQYVKDHPSVQKNVIDVSVSQEADLGNVYQARVILGRRDGTLFDSELQADNYFKRWIKGTDDYEIEQVGQGFQIVIKKNVDEGKFLSDMTLGTNQLIPESLANTFGGWWRSPNYQVSRENELSRSTVVTSTEKLSHIYESMAEPFSRLSNKEKAELDDLMVTNREKQKYYENYGELESAFWSRFKKPPTEGQAEAYFAYVQMNDLDLMVRDLDWYKQKAIQGREEIVTKIDGKDVSFEGKIVDDLPIQSNDDFRWVIIKDGKPLGKTKGKDVAKWDKNRKELQKLKDQGYKIVQVADQSLKIGDKQYVGFVVMKDFKRNRIGVKNVDRKPGGHKVDAYQGYVKQGMIRQTDDRSLYRGDTTLFGVMTEKEGRDLVKILEEARKKILAGDKDAVKFIRDNLPISPKRFMSAVKSGVIDLTVPFSYTKKGTRTIDTGVYSYMKNLDDLGRNSHNLDSQILGRYGGQRDMSDIQVVRSEGDMKFETKGAKYLSPMETLRMASRDMLSVRAMNDYTLQTNRDFIRQFGDILDGTLEEIQSSGISYLMNPKFKAAADPKRVAAAQNVSRAYKNLINYGTELDRKIDAYKDKLLSSVIPRLGPRGRNWVEARMLGSVKDPGVYLRSFAFDLKLGLFNPIQYFVQANSLVNVAAVAGTEGLRGGALYPLFRAALLTNEKAILDKIAKSAEATGLMKANEFTESMNLFRKSGFDQIGKDVASLDDVSGPSMQTSRTKNGVRHVLQLGRKPFQEGERLVRVAGWNAAYLEAKKAAKGRALTRRDEAVILQRAKDLTGNMTRESNAAWQKGYAAVFTQFFGYQARIMEQFLGKKLTRAEKIRLFIGYSAVYGLPVATGAVTGILPIRDIVLDQLYSMGINPDDTAIEPFVDGFVASMIEFITGKEYNIGDRYGPGGLTTFYDVLRGDHELSDLFLGASGSIALQTIQDSIPILKGMASEWMDYKGGLYNLRPEDFLQPLRNISSVDNMTKLYQVYQTGIWASRNEVNLIEMGLPDAVIAALTGLQPAAIEDSFRMLSSTQEWKDHIYAVQKEIVKDYRRAMRMDPGPEREKEVRRLKALMTMNGFTFQQMNQTWRNAADREMLNDVFFEKYQEMQRQMELKGK